MRRIVAIFIGVGLCLAVLPLLLLSKYASATAGINAQLSFEGKIVDMAGLNIPDPPASGYNMEFKIYSGGTATGGGTLKWTEDWLASNSQGVIFKSGTFQVNLGS